MPTTMATVPAVLCVALGCCSVAIGARVAMVKEHDVLNVNLTADLETSAAASRPECSCAKGFKPGIGLPFLGSLTCWTPFSCGGHCSSLYESSCRARALCTLSEGDGRHYCDCSMCSGPTKAQVAYEKACKAVTCRANEKCYVDGVWYGHDGSSVYSGDKPSGTVCVCDFPNAKNGTGDCVPCEAGKYPEFDNQTKSFYCPE
mmetsp:Transcript_26489/g.69084  ORF Transcript_26489/g.69084 Transcript_26489/m.69084 type:complete len:202 (-) Transcript_26489:107-712(-)